MKEKMNFDWLKKFLTSRTVWTVIVTFVVNGVQAISSYLPAEWLPAVNGVLGILIIYFKLNPSQEY